MGGAGLRLGIIGAGLCVTELHWPVIHRYPEKIRVVAIASRSAESAGDLASLTGAVVHRDYKALLSDDSVDAVLIAVPIELNGRVLLDAIRSGKHVIAEKPIASTLELGQEIVAEASKRSSRQVILIAENFRYREDVRIAKRILRDGEIGEVFAFQTHATFDLWAERRRPYLARHWRRAPSYAGGFVLDGGIHPIAALRDLLGEITEIYAQVLDRHSAIEGPDCLFMQLKVANGAVGQHFACYAAKHAQDTSFDFTAYGTGGTLNLTAGRIRWSSDSAGTRFTERTSREDRGYEQQWVNFWAAIENGEPVLSTPERAFGDLVVIHAALRSSLTGTPVSFTNDTETASEEWTIH